MPPQLQRPQAKPKAKAKATARAKAKAKAKLLARANRANRRRQHRRQALTELNALAEECKLASGHVAVKTAVPAEVELLVRLLEGHCDGDRRQRLQTAAQSQQKQNTDGETSAAIPFCAPTGC